MHKMQMNAGEIPEALMGPDLFSRLQYPQDPGYKPTDTSFEAAKKVRPKKEYYENCVIQALRNGPLTDEEIASTALEDFSSIQPARSRLKARGKIIDSGKRGKTARGNSCAKWSLA